MVLIRQAMLEDCDQVFALAGDFATSFRPEYEAFTDAYAQLLGQEDALVLVAEQSGRVLGYLLGFDHWTFFANGRVSWVEEVMVQEDHRRRKVGAALMARFEEWAQSRQSKLVALATRRAAPFYLAIGYEESATYFRRLV
ncbi:MAG: GNAT family N-acetyltransferase [Chloroflexi bacterium]|nr:GNAT family N-acetyltransferase [Chloroflexota bacterium]